MVPRAYLRVFEPLDAFPPLERRWWDSYVASGAGISRVEAEEAESRASLGRVLAPTRRAGGGARTWSATDNGIAFVRRVGRRVHVCPLELELRAAAALRNFRKEVPGPLVDAFLPDGELRQSLEQLERQRRAPHIRESTWTVPLEWFAMFDPNERHFTDPPEGSGPRVTYLTSLSQSAERLEHVMDVVENNLEHNDDVLAELADLADWIDEFDESSLLELDYGGIAAIATAAVLAEDVSCATVWQAVQSLADGDQFAAAAHYGVARGRWTRLASMRSAN